MQIASDFKRMTVDFIQAFKNRQDCLNGVREFVRDHREGTQKLLNQIDNEHKERAKTLGIFLNNHMKNLHSTVRELRSKNYALINATHNKHREIEKAYDDFVDKMREARGLKPLAPEEKPKRKKRK